MSNTDSGRSWAIVFAAFITAIIGPLMVYAGIRIINLAIPDRQPNPTQESISVSVAPPTSIPAATAAQSFDCTVVVSSSRPVTPMGTGDSCWLKLYDGSPTQLTFNDSAQITFRTLTGGNDVYFFIAKKGDRLSDVVGATIRPMAFVLASFGTLDNAKKFEIAYHSPGYQGGFMTCIRDANNGNQPLNSLCK